MTERERMLAGKGYKALDKGLSQDRLNARRQLYQFNTCEPHLFARRETILRQLLGSAGKDLYIEPPFQCDYGYNIKVGDRFYANFNCVILDCGPITIGDDVLFGPGVQLYPVGHPLDSALRKEGWEHAKPITIGDRVWVGGGTVILPGVTIGDGAVIGAGSVVTKSIPGNVLAAGNPCKVLREITEQDRLDYQQSYID